MGVVRYVSPERIAAHAKEVRDNVVAPLNKAGESLNQVYNLEGGDFSITCTMAAVAYPGALQFAFNTLKTHIRQATGFADKLDASARNWADTEDRNTFTV